MTHNFLLRCFASLSLLLGPAAGAQVVLTPDVHEMPGEPPTPFLVYENPAASDVTFKGAWDGWDRAHVMTRKGNQWVFDVRSLALPFGYYEFKFLPDGEWESGENRAFYINRNGLFERPPDVIARATIDAPDRIHVHFRRSLPEKANLEVRLEPEVPLEGWRLITSREQGFPEGFRVSGNALTFIFDEQLYGVDIPPGAQVVVAGNFNNWDGTGRNPRWRLLDRDNNNVWERTVPATGLRNYEGTPLEFKFVVNNNQWLAPPEGALNAADDGKGNVNLRLDLRAAGSSRMEIATREPLDLTQSYFVKIDGAADRTTFHPLTPEGVFQYLHSDKELGAILMKDEQATTYRVFAPRATSVHLCIYDGPYFEKDGERIEPAERYLMWKDPDDGVWEMSLLGLDTGKYYVFEVDGPQGPGEAFNPNAAVGDPYAYAAAHAENNPIVIDREATNQWFGGWTDQDYQTRPPQDVVIYEAHVRDLTIHPSSGVPDHLKGTYEGILASEGTGTGLDHLKAMGFNTLELLPINEFNNGPGGHNWGYTTVYFFAPEASYARDPLRGSQYYEFKHFVNEMHNKGFGVILDVVYNHVGYPNIFAMLDKKYYFRLNPDFSFMNFSGVGNDFKSESPMARRLIVDNIVYWVKEFHIDGFRFDLAELIDMETLMEAKEAARAINPNVLMISEPWSFRGEHKSKLKGTGWAAWNNDFRYISKDFVMGTADREWLIKNIFGSVDTWTANPMQTVNYMESHDDMALADEISTVPNQDARTLRERDVKANRLGATLIFTSLGIPMIAEGQEYLRSKHGFHNTYDKGDPINALNWEDRERPMAKETMEYYRGLSLLRASEAGRAFRVAERPPDTYYQWLRPANQRALGYIVNAPRRHPGNGFVVLLNSDSSSVSFEVSLPAGNWRVISDGETVQPEGLPGKPLITGPRKVRISVPGVDSVILMDGF